MNRRCITAVLLLLAAAQAFGHHILGIPHYSYDKDYPQAPVLTYKVQAGPNEVRMTGYPGRPQPEEACTLHVYIRGIDGGVPFDGGVTLSVFHDRLIGADPIIYGPIQAELDEAMYKFYPRFGHEANYVVRIEFEAEGAPWIIDLPMVVGEPGSPWAVLGSVGGGLLLFVIVIRAIRIKQRRRAVQSPASAEAAA